MNLLPPSDDEVRAHTHQELKIALQGERILILVVRSERASALSTFTALSPEACEQVPRVLHGLRILLAAACGLGKAIGRQRARQALGEPYWLLASVVSVQPSGVDAESVMELDRAAELLCVLTNDSVAMAGVEYERLDMRGEEHWPVDVGFDVVIEIVLTSLVGELHEPWQFCLPALRWGRGRCRGSRRSTRLPFLA